MTVKVQRAAHTPVMSKKKIHGKKKDKAASKGTLSHTSKYPFIFPLL